MMTPAVGLDLCGISRMEPLLRDDRFLDRYFTPEEKAYIRSRGNLSAQSMAGIYAAKEAFVKALGTGIAFPLSDIGITHTSQGQPGYVLSGQALALLSGRMALLSISHEDNVAAAVCMLIPAPEPIKEEPR